MKPRMGLYMFIVIIVELAILGAIISWVMGWQ